MRRTRRGDSTTGRGLDRNRGFRPVNSRISRYERAHRLTHLAHQLREVAERELLFTIDMGEVEPLVKLSGAQADVVHSRLRSCGDRTGYEIEDGGDWSLVEPDTPRKTCSVSSSPRMEWLGGGGNTAVVTRDMSEHWGYGTAGAHVGPLVVDGLMVVCGFALLALSPRRETRVTAAVPS